jgi:hypothetical protein
MVLKTFSFYRLILTGAFVLAGSASAESKWAHMRSDNLEMFSETTTIRSQETLRALEQIHAFLIKAVGARDVALGTTCIVAFKSEEDFAHFRPKSDISYSIAGADRDYVVFGLPETGSFEPGARAYAEVLTGQLGLRPPAWLDDGLKGIYATFGQRGADVIAGEIGPVRRKALVTDTWGSLDQTLGSGANSRTARDQRFALVHMLLLNPDYAPKFKDLLAELQSGTASQAALEKVYGKPLSALEKDLKEYAHSPAFSGTLISSRGAVIAVTPAEPASPFDVNLALAGIINQPGRESDVQAWLDRLAGMNPERPEPWAGLGYLALRRGQSDVAAQNFEKAITLGSRDPGVLWSRGQIARGASSKDTEESVRTLLNKEPARADLRVKLAAIALDQRRPGLAVSLLAPVKDVPADLSARYLATLAFAQLETGEASAAKLTVARLADGSASPSDKAEAARLRDFLAGPTHVTLGSSPAAATAAVAQEKTEAQKAAVEEQKKAAEAHEKELAEARDKAAADAREKLEAKAREKADAEQRAQEAVAARVKAELEAKEKLAAEAQEKKDARVREKAEREAKTKAIADARERAAAEARDKALAEAAEKQEAKAREKAAAEARVKAAEEAHQKLLADLREKAEADAREKAAADARAKTEALAKAQAESDARAKAPAEARQKAAEPTVLAKAAQETRQTAAAYSATAQPQQASNLVPESNAAAPAPVFPSMLSGSFVELGCGDQIKVVVQTEQGKKNFRIKNPANVIVSGKGGGTVDLNCGPQKPTNVRIQYGPGDGGFDGSVEAIYFE